MTEIPTFDSNIHIVSDLQIKSIDSMVTNCFQFLTDDGLDVILKLLNDEKIITNCQQTSDMTS